MSSAGTLIASLIMDLIKIVTSSNDDEEILERLAKRVAEAVKDINRLPTLQADRWADLRREIGEG
jgi:predicted neutral ceramidase superfamily lipid hydrolase